MDNNYSTVPMWLVYELDSEGLRLCQPYQEVVEVGTLIDQSTGDDLRVVGWTTEDPYTGGTTVLPNGDWVMPEHVRANLLAAGARAANIRRVTDRYASILRDIYENRRAGDWTFEGVLGNFAQDLGVL